MDGNSACKQIRKSVANLERGGGGGGGGNDGFASFFTPLMQNELANQSVNDIFYSLTRLKNSTASLYLHHPFVRYAYFYSIQNIQ